MAQKVKGPPAVQAMQKAQVRSLGQEEPLEEVMATHSSILAWKIAWTGKPGVLLSMKAQIRHDLATEHTAIPYNTGLHCGANWREG